MGSYGVFMPVYLESISVSQRDIGLLLSASVGITAASSLVWGFISDRYHSRNAILSICIIGYGLFISLYLFTHSIFLISIFTIAAAFFFKPLLPLIDGAALETVRHPEAAASFGDLRVWGTIGFLYANFALSYIIGVSGLQSLFIINISLSVIALSIPYFLEKNNLRVAKEKVKFSSLSFFLHKNFIIIFIIGVIIEIGCSAIYGCYSLFLSKLGFSNQMIGIAWGAGVFVEIPVLLLSDKIIAAFGVKFSIISGLTAHIIKFIFLAFVDIHTPAYIIIVMQITHGIFFGAFYPALVKLVNISTPSNLNNTGQSLFIASTYAIGAIIGFMLNGYLSDFYGFSKLFMINSLLIMFGAASYFFIDIKGMVIYEKK